MDQWRTCWWVGYRFSVLGDLTVVKRVGSFLLNRQNPLSVTGPLLTVYCVR